MKSSWLWTLPATLLLVACGGSDGDKPVPAPVTVDIDEATAIELTLLDFDPQSSSVEFRLQDDSALPITGAGSDYSVNYLAYPDSFDTAFRFPWHGSDRFGCGEAVPQCLGDLEELSAGHYRFTPDRAPDLGAKTDKVKLFIEVNGALAGNNPSMLDPAELTQP